jgi:hypothetical protein
MADVFRVVQCWVFDLSPLGGSRVSVGCSVVFVKSTMLRSQIMGGTKDELQSTVTRFEKFLRGCTQEYRRVNAVGMDGGKWAVRSPLPPLQLQISASASVSAGSGVVDGGQCVTDAAPTQAANAHASSAAATATAADDDSTDRAMDWLSPPLLWIIVGVAALLVLLYMWWVVGPSGSMTTPFDPHPIPAGDPATSSATTADALEQRLVSMEHELQALRQLLEEQQTLALRLSDQCAAAGGGGGPGGGPGAAAAPP